MGLRQEHKEKPTFSSCLFQFKVMQFGLCNASATFEGSGPQKPDMKTCLAYLVDVIAIRKTFKDPLENLKEVLTRIHDAQLKLSPSIYEDQCMKPVLWRSRHFKITLHGRII